MRIHARPIVLFVFTTAAVAFGVVSGLVVDKDGFRLGKVSVVNLATSDSTLTDVNGAWSLGTQPVKARGHQSSSLRLLPGNILRIEAPVAGMVNISAFGIDGKKLVETDHSCRPGTNDIPVARMSRVVTHLRIRIGDQTTVVPWGNSAAHLPVETAVAMRGLGVDSFVFTLEGYHRVSRSLRLGQDTLLVTMVPVDSDMDGRADLTDNCPEVKNFDQRDWDWDKKGDACDDSDGDGILDTTIDLCTAKSSLPCPETSDDQDGDGVPNSMDNCPTVFNPILTGTSQPDTDLNGVGDRCDFRDPSLLPDPRGGGSSGYYVHYRTSMIGNQVWMAENLVHPIGGGGSHCYRDSAKFCMTYGLLYSWSAAQNACPAGWHLPSPAEWDSLIAFVGPDSVGPRLRTTYGWAAGWNGTDDYGFSAIPTGMRWGSMGKAPSDTFAGTGSRYWSSGISTLTKVLATSVYLTTESGATIGSRLNVATADTTGHAYSVRCIKD
jgi:uncharacterized protein (TIGR02145 family)